MIPNGLTRARAHWKCAKRAWRAMRALETASGYLFWPELTRIATCHRHSAEQQVCSALYCLGVRKRAWPVPGHPGLLSMITMPPSPLDEWRSWARTWLLDDLDYLINQSTGRPMTAEDVAACTDAQLRWHVTNVLIRRGANVKEPV